MKTKSIKQRIKEYFLKNPTSNLRVRQIEREVKVPLPSVIKYTKELEKEGILKHSTIADVTVYSANRTSKAFFLEKRVFNIRDVTSSRLIDHLIEEFSNPSIIMFGSYSKGEDVENSDIDIFIETPSKKETLSLEKFEKKLKRKIQIFMFKDIRSIPNKELANSILNGVILNGFIEVF